MSVSVLQSAEPIKIRQVKKKLKVTQFSVSFCYALSCVHGLRKIRIVLSITVWAAQWEFYFFFLQLNCCLMYISDFFKIYGTCCVSTRSVVFPEISNWNCQTFNFPVLWTVGECSISGDRRLADKWKEATSLMNTLDLHQLLFTHSASVVRTLE